METKLPKEMKKFLCVPSLLKVARRSFEKIRDAVNPTSTISLPDCLMSGVALFGLKFPSLLQFDTARQENRNVCHNLRSLYGIEQAPCDTYFRERLDEVRPETFNTLKNQGYPFEHNFGHGNKNLSTVLAYLMFVAFFAQAGIEMA